MIPGGVHCGGCCGMVGATPDGALYCQPAGMGEALARRSFGDIVRKPTQAEPQFVENSLPLQVCLPRGEFHCIACDMTRIIDMDDRSRLPWRFFSETLSLHPV